jgi:hypothetical protein
MVWKHRVTGGTIAFIGFMLSPLSWWNDLVVNVPLAVGFAWLVSAFYPPCFRAAVIVGYWLTNILGFWLMHKGARRAFLDQGTPYTRRSLVRDLITASAYTVLILVLIRLHILQPLSEYLPQHR